LTEWAKEVEAVNKLTLPVEQGEGGEREELVKIADQLQGQYKVDL
jgi:hypothetical protein